MKTQKEGYRQGDVRYFLTDTLPEGLKESKSSIILQTGSGGNPHTFKGGKFYPLVEGDFKIGYLVAKNTKIFHIEHNPKGTLIQDGIYEVGRQVEETPDELKPVID
jgi:hypothetical protein